MTRSSDGTAEARRRIAEEAEQRTGRLDLRDLGLEALPEELVALQHLRELDLGRSRPWGDDAPRNRIQAQQARLGELAELETLSVAGTDLADPGHPAELRRLTSLDCSRTRISDLSPLAGLSGLQRLDCSRTGVSDLSPLAGLTRLQRLDCSSTRVSDLLPLASLAGLEELHCSDTRVSDLSPLAGLTGLQRLDCSRTSVSDLLPLAGLAGLQRLDCSSTRVSDLSPLAGRAGLQELRCSSTRVSDLSPLAGLSGLQELNCAGTGVSDLSPLAGLAELQELDCSWCRLAAMPAGVLRLPSLCRLVLHEVQIPGVPGEVLSNRYDDDCQAALRAHVADLEAEEPAASDARLLLLGNGQAGKTQIARWLRGEGFDPAVPSTHGIQLGAATLAGDPPVRLQVWDFGGQDIYHGTHALSPCCTDRGPGRLRVW